MHRPKGLVRVSGELYGEAVASVMAVIGPCSDEDAMRVVDAVLGPLKLVSPMPEMTMSYAPCGHTRFTYKGEWHACTIEHDDDDDDGDLELHGNEETDWFAGNADGRSFAPKSKPEA